MTMMSEMNKEREKKSDSTKKSPFVLNRALDLEIFKLIYEHRFLRREHISALSRRGMSVVQRRLSKLIEAGYLQVKGDVRSIKHIYGLGYRALPLLVEEGSADPELLTDRLRMKELTELFFSHEMMIVDFHAILTLAKKRGSHLRLVDWQEGKGLWHSLTVPGHKGMEKHDVHPDALFTLADSRRPEGENLFYVFLEADWSQKESHLKFGRKIHGYRHCRELGLHKEWFGIDRFRVLTLTRTHARALNLWGMTAELLPEGARKPFFFTSLNENLSLENPTSVFDDICLKASEPDPNIRFPLVPAPILDRQPAASSL
jgi:Replication-relaxation